MAARWVGALMYAAAAAGAAIGALAYAGPLEFTQVREAAPLAAAIGALLGLGVNQRWPLRADSAVATGLLTALAGLVLFSGAYLLGSTFIEAYLGKSATEAVTAASTRLGERMPVAAPLAIGGFMAAGLVMWVIGALGRVFFRRRAAEAEAEAAPDADTPRDNGDPGAAGVT